MKNDVKYLHLTGARTTIAVQHDGTLAIIGVARAEPNDQFSKKIGRNIALGRIESERTDFIPGRFFVPASEIADETGRIDWNATIRAMKVCGRGLWEKEFASTSIVVH